MIILTYQNEHFVNGIYIYNLANLARDIVGFQQPSDVVVRVEAVKTSVTAVKSAFLICATVKRSKHGLLFHFSHEGWSSRP